MVWSCLQDEQRDSSKNSTNMDARRKQKKGQAKNNVATNNGIRIEGCWVDLGNSCKESPRQRVDLGNSSKESPRQRVDLGNSCKESPRQRVDLGNSCKESPRQRVNMGNSTRRAQDRGITWGTAQGEPKTEG